MDLFSHSHSKAPIHVPLAEKLRPSEFSLFLGQTKAFGENSPLRRLIDQGHLPSLILWGPPGCGKTTFARLLSTKIDAEFVAVSATDSGSTTLRELGEAAKARRQHFARRTVLFVDEIHRFNKGQQDILLPFVESGDFVLIGATTENPSYELRSALLSRCQLIVFDKLDLKDLQTIVRHAYEQSGLEISAVLTPEALDVLCQVADGDARRLLNNIENILRVFQSPAKEDFLWPLAAENLNEFLSTPSLYYDRDGDSHYDTISAFIKSIRGSDPDAAVYYLARMLKGGEDPVFIARRLMILASEDISNADPRALSLAVAGLQAVEAIGLPEAAITLAQVTVYLACAPKSNRSYLALLAAQEEVEKSGRLPIPLHLRSANTTSMKKLGYGRDYKYSHNGEKGWLPQNYLPEAINQKKFLELSEHGFEKTLQQYLKWIRS